MAITGLDAGLTTEVASAAGATAGAGDTGPDTTLADAAAAAGALGAGAAFVAVATPGGLSASGSRVSSMV